MDNSTDRYGLTPAQRRQDAIDELYDNYEEDIQEEGGILEKTSDGIRFQYPTGKAYQITVTQLEYNLLV